jgi:hypothetical protein
MASHLSAPPRWGQLAETGEGGGGGGSGGGGYGLISPFSPPTASNPISAIFCFGNRIYEFLRRKQKAQRWRNNTILRRLCIERKDGARLFAQIKACTIHKAQSFALCSH